jgi:hypothetical protein
LRRLGGGAWRHALRAASGHRNRQGIHIRQSENRSRYEQFVVYMANQAFALQRDQPQVSMPNDMSQLRVLVVDDEPLICWSIAETLGDCGVVVTQRATGWQRFARSPPRLSPTSCCSISICRTLTT